VPWRRSVTRATKLDETSRIDGLASRRVSEEGDGSFAASEMAPDGIPSYVVNTALASRMVIADAPRHGVHQGTMHPLVSMP
jgi:hypothetical protein